MVSSGSMVISAIVGALLMASGLGKFRRSNILETIRDYRVLPLAVAARVASGLPYLETGLGLALVVGFVMRPALLLAATLFLAFAWGICVNLARGRAIDCGCRSRARPISWQLFAFDSVLTFTCVAIFFVDPPGLLQGLLGMGQVSVSQSWAGLAALVVAALAAKGIELQFELGRELQRTRSMMERASQ